MKIKKKTLKDVDISGQTVFVRVDFNVPLKENGDVTDARRIEESLPTIRHLIEKKAKVVLASHLGRPKGKKDPKYSLSGVAKKLSELLNNPVVFVPDCVGDETLRVVRSLSGGGVLLLENVRFYQEEEKNDRAFAEKLAAGAELFVNDAFGAAHRAHASTEGVAHVLPSCMGLLIEKELSILSSLLEAPEKPFVTILGGAKVSDKLGVIESLMPRVDTFLVGGGMAFTFLKAQGKRVGRSLVEEEKLPLAKKILEKMRSQNKKFILPSDVVASESVKEEKNVKVVNAGEIPENALGVDIGTETQKQFGEFIKGAKTLFWNGPLGVYEVPAFAKGTEFTARTAAGSSCVSIVGGGDVVAAINALGLSEKFTHISTGGGATLEFLEGKDLPGVACLSDK